MAVSAISGALPQQTNPYAQDRQAFSQLTSAIQSGDLAGAQQAYATLASSPAAQGNSPFAQAIQQIGRDLQTGDLTDAQKALASLQQAHGHHHHHHGAKSADESNSTNQNQSSASDPNGNGNTSLVNLTV